MKTDVQFLESLRGSQVFVSAVASWMARHGCDVMIRPLVERPEFGLRNEFADSGDLEIRQRVEVKHRDLDFTSVEDYPYGSVIVDERYKVERIPRGRLWGYVIMSRGGTHVCCVRSDTRSQWLVESMYDKKDKQRREFYVCPKELCLFCRLV